ncbi:Putative transciptional regulator [Halorhabdus sp. SVX81]|uniref:Fic family protein n=1 Tax=Halorhabdus sp. SVX81 TaxID=2978283 RepID=UPI0023DA372F|nr:Fic family protein [Halorhabdus sp. SVX81]WEL17147.1 Putative transciptional regulator [Halorhabdus sp. SVX81]
MARDGLPDEAPGKYVPFGQRSYYLPDELPPADGIEFSSGFQETLQDAIYQLGRLEGISEQTDASPIVYTSLVRREAVESVLIEGADIELEDLFRPEDIDHGETTKDTREGINYETAVREGATRVSETGEITVDLLHDLHGTLMAGVRDEGDGAGAFRTAPVHIPPPEPHLTPFVPPAATKVPSLVDNLVAYIQDGGAYHDLVDLGLVHYQFETIHPYGDGNGRLGRLLITLQLIKQGYLSDPYLYPSAYFNEHKIEYVNRMRAVSEEGAWEPWLQFFVDGIRQQAADAVTRTDELRDLRREYEVRYGHEKTARDRLAMRLFQYPYVTTKEVQKLLDVSHQTARNAITTLEDEDVLQETTGKERYQEFKAVDIFDILTRSFDGSA